MRSVVKQGDIGAMSGFTLVELVLIILLLGILSVTVVQKWPTGMDTEAAALEFKRAVRYAQHKAMTREFIAGNPWGLVVADSHYTIKQHNDDSGPDPDFNNRLLLDPDGSGKVPANKTMTITGGPENGLWFNGLGEPIDKNGVPLGAVTYIIAGAESMTICPQTGYLMRGASCP